MPCWNTPSINNISPRHFARTETHHSCIAKANVIWRNALYKQWKSNPRKANLHTPGIVLKKPYTFANFMPSSSICKRLSNCRLRQNIRVFSRHFTRTFSIPLVTAEFCFESSLLKIKNRVSLGLRFSFTEALLLLHDFCLLTDSHCQFASEVCTSHSLLIFRPFRSGI